ncbi:MAG TPA: acyl carrier protein [Pseudonocardiaceae bacterium]|nr:acyl carrier protein [Pseudonocardiaceae bacterium]
MSQHNLGLADLRRLLTESAGVSQGVDMDGDIADASFDDLGYDSIALMEIAARITSTYGVPIEDDALAEATTPRLLLELVNGH